MKRKGNIKRYWFCRSFLFSLTIFLCLGFLFLGGASCYAIMESNLSGEEILLIEKQGRVIRILGHNIIN